MCDPTTTTSSSSSSGSGSVVVRHSVSCEATLFPHVVVPSLSSLTSLLSSFLLERSKKHALQAGRLPTSSWSDIPALRSAVEHLRLTDFPPSMPSLSFWELSDDNVELNVYCFHASSDPPESDDACDDGGGDADECTHTLLQLPSQLLDGSWDSLVLPEGVKSSLLSYVESALFFSDVGVDYDVISCNRLLLLYGPPGSGKTTLCKSLANKMSIRLRHRYPSSCLLEINAHSLFSKWFSESGKKVSSLFAYIHETCLDDPENLVFVLVDEVESLVGSRSSAIGTGEPGDSLRAVNAVLTGLDRLRRLPNVVVLTTTNMHGASASTTATTTTSSALDGAFLDRADVKLYVGNPTAPAAYDILRSCVAELLRAGVLRESDVDETESSSSSSSPPPPEGGPTNKNKHKSKCCNLADAYEAAKRRALSEARTNTTTTGGEGGGSTTNGTTQAHTPQRRPTPDMADCAFLQPEQQPPPPPSDKGKAGEHGLLVAAAECAADLQMSGRALRKAPFICYSKAFGATGSGRGRKVVGLMDFLLAMKRHIAEIATQERAEKA